MNYSQTQFVCEKCGYNMIGFYPKSCPFCGASNENFITAKECSQKYKIVSFKVNSKVTSLKSYPSFGLEHSAYSISTNNKVFWIDCPSTFSKDLEPMDKIFFTHNHFLGASNLYRGYYTSFVWIHKYDSEHPLSNKHPFDKKFTQDFKFSGIEAFHINGHTRGFTFYIFENILFICDYFIKSNGHLILNPYGPIESTKKGAQKFYKLVENREIETVCGYNYVIDYQNWKKDFLMLLKKNSEK